MSAALGQEALARELAASAHRRGARFVDVTFFDPWAKRARSEHAAEHTLDVVPTWYAGRNREQGRVRCAHRARRIRSRPGGCAAATFRRWASG